MALTTQHKHAFSSVNLCYDEGEAIANPTDVEGDPIMAYDNLYPAQNAMDPMPYNVARANVLSGGIWYYRFKVWPDFQQNWPLFRPSGMVLINIRNRTVLFQGGGNDTFTGYDFEFRLRASNDPTFPGGAATTTLTFNAWEPWSRLDGHNIFVDFEAAGTVNATLNRSYYEIALRAKPGDPSLSVAQLGGVILTFVYRPSRTPTSVSTDIEKMNVQTSTIPNMVILHRSHHPARVVSASWIIDSNAEARQLETLLSGNDFTLGPGWDSYANRLNHIQAWIRPREWVNNYYGTCMVGAFSKARLEELKDGLHRFSCTFNEIPRESH